MDEGFVSRPDGCTCDNSRCPQHNRSVTGRFNECRCNILTCKIHGVIRLQLMASEAYLIKVMLEAAMEQYNAASDEERRDPDLIRMRDMLARIIPLPSPIPETV